MPEENMQTKISLDYYKIMAKGMFENEKNIFSTEILQENI